MRERVMVVDGWTYIVKSNEPSRQALQEFAQVWVDEIEPSLRKRKEESPGA